MTCPNTGWGENPKMIIEQTRLSGTQEYTLIQQSTSLNFNCFLVLAHDDITCMVCGPKIDGTDVYEGICKDKDDAGVEIECSDEAGKSCMTSIISK